jgi:hypothetical protein
MRTGVPYDILGEDMNRVKNADSGIAAPGPSRWTLVKNVSLAAGSVFPAIVPASVFDTSRLNLMEGMLVGGGVGLAVGAAQDRNHCGDPSSDYCYHKIAGGVIGLGIGTAGDAVIPAGPKILYRAIPPRRRGK